MRPRRVPGGQAKAAGTAACAASGWLDGCGASQVTESTITQCLVMRRRARCVRSLKGGREGVTYYFRRERGWFTAKKQDEMDRIPVVFAGYAAERMDGFRILRAP